MSCDEDMTRGKERREEELYGSWETGIACLGSDV